VRDNNVLRLLVDFCGLAIEWNNLSMVVTELYNEFLQHVILGILMTIVGLAL
jgi:hypothetical protein